MGWGKTLVENRKLGSKLVVLLLVVGFVGFVWQAIRPLVFNGNMYDFNSYYISAYATQKGFDPYDSETLQVLAKRAGFTQSYRVSLPAVQYAFVSAFEFPSYPSAVLLWRVFNLALIAFVVWLIKQALSLPLDAKTVLVIGLIVFTFDPLIYNLAIGQINLVILCLLAGTAYAWVRHRQVLAGVLLALAALIKIVQIILFLIFCGSVVSNRRRRYFSDGGLRHDRHSCAG